MHGQHGVGRCLLNGGPNLALADRAPLLCEFRVFLARLRVEPTVRIELRVVREEQQVGQLGFVALAGSNRRAEGAAPVMGLEEAMNLAAVVLKENRLASYIGYELVSDSVISSSRSCS